MRFSIIVPVYNVAPYLRECLDSIAIATRELLSESPRDGVEVICVDDGSTDGSAAILDAYGLGSDSSCVGFQLKVLHQSNAGVSAARNAALDIALGEWLLFVDADDCLAAGALARVSRVLRCSDAAIEFLAFGSTRFSDGTAVSRELMPSAEVEFLDYQSFFRRGIYHRNIWEGCYKRMAFGDLRFRVGVAMGEDKLYQAGVFARVKSVALIRDRLYCYRVRPGSAVNSPMTAKKLVDRVNCRLAIDGLFDAAHRCPVGDERAHALYMTEGFSRDYFGLGESERELVRPHWDRVLRHYLKRETAPWWCRFASWCALTFRFDWVRYILFRTPFYFKQHGIHRRRRARG